MNKGDTLQLSVRDVPGLETIFTHPDEIIKNGKITVEVDDSIPFDRPYVVKFKVSSEGKFGPMQFQFKVKEQDLLDKGISRNDLRLYQELKVYSLQLLKVNHGYLYYLVTVPSMGHFVLGRVEAVETAVVVEEEKVAEAPAVEEQPVEVIEETAAEPSVVIGKAAEQPAPEMEQKGFFARIADFFRNLFYGSGSKSVPATIKKLPVSSLSLAVWFMDDGTLDYRVKSHYSFSFSTDSFSQSDVRLLQEVLYEKFKIKTSIQTPSCRGKKYIKLYVGKDGRDIFLSTIQPYILSCFDYKLPQIILDPSETDLEKV